MQPPPGPDPWADSMAGGNRGRQREYDRPQPYPMRQPVQQPTWQPNPQAYWPQQPPAQPGRAPQPPGSPRKSRKGLAFLGCGAFGALVVLIATLASSSSSSSTPAAGQPQAPDPAQAKAAVAQTVTYVVTGPAADVTYGPAGTELSGTVPMRVSKPLGTPAYYSIDAQLQGRGTVSCQILVNGQVISQGTASGGYQIASCEIGQDPFSGQWQDDNG